MGLNNRYGSDDPGDGSIHSLVALMIDTKLLSDLLYLIVRSAKALNPGNRKDFFCQSSIIIHRLVKK